MQKFLFTFRKFFREISPFNAKINEAKYFREMRKFCENVECENLVLR